ncbi:MAG: DUF3379 family protein [Gammaproteobacteria bacterium]
MTTKLTPEERRRREAIVVDDARFEALLEAAFKVDAPQARPVHARPRWPAVFAIAATLVLAAGAWLGLRTDTPGFDVSPLAPDIVAHIQHEPKAMVVTARTVPATHFEGVLQGGRASLSNPVGQVSYARLCPFRGQMVAHFVVQGEHGPVTVMLLPDEHVTAATAIDERGFKGTVVPVESGGSVAIVGQPDEDLEEIRDRLLEAVRWNL